MKDSTKRALEGLHERERQVLVLRYALDGGDPMTAEEVGSRMGLSRQAVRDLELHALSSIRASQQGPSPSESDEEH